MAELHQIRTWAEALIHTHLDATQWTFDFDNAKTRAGQCNYSMKRITISHHLVGRYSDDQIHQVLLHEIAHACAGAEAGHGARWRAIAAELGYEGKKLTGETLAATLAPWLGTCPAAHLHYRYRKPSRSLSCGACSPRFNTAHRISWEKRELPSMSPKSTQDREERA